ncbi:hypothetical protein MKK68_02310 [Methylobacterium sp. E-016]|nr:hypothetical protein [Methylobacterium sp. E-016]
MFEVTEALPQRRACAAEAEGVEDVGKRSIVRRAVAILADEDTQNCQRAMAGDDL